MPQPSSKNAGVGRATGWTFIPHPAISDISFKGFDDVMENHVKTLSRLVSEHQIAIDRIAQARAKYGLT